MSVISQIFDIENKPSEGCTEPNAAGYAACLAYNAISGRVPEWLKRRIPIKYIEGIREQDIEVTKIKVAVSRGILKNALAVGIPYSGGQKGIDTAVAMAVFCFPEKEGKELTLFKGLKPEDRDKARELKKKVEIGTVEGWETGTDIKIAAAVEVRHKQFPERILRGTAIIENGHCNVTSIDAYDSAGQVRDIPCTKKSEVKESAQDIKNRLKGMKVSEIIAEVGDLPEDAYEKMIDLLEMNMLVSEKGLDGKKGLGIATALRDLVQEGYLKDDFITSSQMMVAAAADSRMSGYDCAVMSVAGSGNQGISASLPVIAVAEKSGCDVKRLLKDRKDGKLSADDKKKLDRLVKSLALSSAMTAYVTYHTDYLSAMCGCAIKAGMGAAAGIAYFMTESADTVEMALQNMAANIPGLICDGAKEGCSLKLTTSASVAVHSALLAMKGICVPPDNGIVAEKVEDTIKNIGKICQAMVGTDTTITRIMLEKSRKVQKSKSKEKRLKR